MSCPSVTFVLQHGGFVPHEWLATKGLLLLKVHEKVTTKEKTNKNRVKVKVLTYLN